MYEKDRYQRISADNPTALLAVWTNPAAGQRCSFCSCISDGDYVEHRCPNPCATPPIRAVDLFHEGKQIDAHPAACLNHNTLLRALVDGMRGATDSPPIEASGDE